MSVEKKGEWVRQNEVVQSTIEAQETQKKVAEVQSDLKSIEDSVVTEKSKQETQSLNTQMEIQKFENMPLNTYSEIVKGTELEQRMIKVLSDPIFNNDKTYPHFQAKTPEQRAEYLFRKINTWISRFYARKFGLETASPVPEYLHKVIVPATELFLMDMLRGGQQNNINFLWAIDKINIDSLNSLFLWVKDFAEKFKLPYTQWKKLMLIADFLALPAQKYQLSQLKNPYDFYEKVMQNSLWDKEDLDLKTLKMSDFWLLDMRATSQKDLQESQELIEQAKNKVRSSIWSIQMVENPETIKKLYTVVDKTEGFFNATDKISTGLMQSMDKVWGAIQALHGFWIDVFSLAKESKLLGWVLNFVLGLLGFSWGVEGIERNWKRRQIDKQLTAPKKAFLSELLKEYSENRNKTDLSDQVLADFRVKIEEKEKYKLNIDLVQLKKSLLNKITNGHQLNLSVLNWLPSKALFVDVVKNQNGKEELKLKPDFLTNDEVKSVFIDEYLKVVIPKMTSNNNFMKTIDSSEELVFAMSAGVCVDASTLMMGMEADAIFPHEFFAFPQQEKSHEDPQNKIEQEQTNINIKKYEGKLMLYNELKWSEQEKSAFKTKLETVSQNLNINPNWLMAVMKKESGFDPRITNKSTNATGLIQFVPDTARSLGTSVSALKNMSAIDQLNYIEKYYKGGNYNGVKDLYLKTFFPAAMKYSDDPNYVFKSKDISAQQVARANPWIAKNDNQITMKDFNDYIKWIINETVPSEFKDQFA